MSTDGLSVREMDHGDTESIINYWLHTDVLYLQGMGVDLSKVPSKEKWTELLTEQLGLPVKEKQSYCIIWLLDNESVGHSNVNKILFGQEAYMHIHLWDPQLRKKGYGSRFVRLTLPYFFEKLSLKKLYCEPYALNPAPNKMLEKLGFQFLKEYTTTPGWLNFEQPVKLWEMTRERYVNENRDMYVNPDPTTN